MLKLYKFNKQILKRVSKTYPFQNIHTSFSKLKFSYIRIYQFSLILVRKHGEYEWQDPKSEDEM